MEYNLDELDANLSNNTETPLPKRPSLDRHRTTGGHSGGGGSRNYHTRRGSLMPPGVDTAATSTKSGLSGGSFGLGAGRRSRTSDLNLFNFELRDLAQKVLLTDGDTHASYHEFAVYAPPGKDLDGPFRSPSIMADDDEALRLFRGSIRDGHGLDDEGEFVEAPPGKPRLLGRVRQLIVDRRPLPVTHDSNSHQDGLFITPEDYSSLELHASTLPTIGRVTSESSFWDARKETLYIVLSFSANPQPPYDFLSMAYKLKTRTTTALIRRSFDTRWHDEDALDEYEKRLEASRSLWAHPLVLPIVLLQVQFLRTEEEVVANNDEVLDLEAKVDDLTGSAKSRRRRFPKNQRRGSSSGNKSDAIPFSPLRRFSTFVEEKVTKRSHDPGCGNGRSSYQERNPALYGDDYVPPQTIHLMKEAHDVLKGAIKLLDTLRWMERAVKLLVTVGDELDAQIKKLRSRATSNLGSKVQRVDGDDCDDEDELSHQWHEIRQYLESTWRLCTALETDRRMSELRCRAQIDIIYSKMAQEDNNLNARMAVASTRDSSSMKALAVITAIFLPGEYMGTLFGTSFFNWEYNTKGDAGLSEDATRLDMPHVVIMPLFWVYWCFTIPLTFFIVVLWRAWWVNQDRFFRRHLSIELSNERYWTSDGRPRDLETTFMQDFLSVFKRSGAGNTSNSSIVGEGAAASAAARKKWMEQQGLQSPGFQRRVMSTTTSASLKEGDGTDTTDDMDGARRRMKSRTISFAGPGARDPGSAV
ncbi:hypothetical protein PG993_009536 [Apiospora rasikravindrae]|uniref:Uncharacterized protein n=1 Tax=Apiospora rasikravindrae TaxID=990691 RepID=A0ABR1SJN3_9PEZI